MIYSHSIRLFKTEVVHLSIMVTHNNASNSSTSAVQNSISFLQSNKGKPLLVLSQHLFKCNKTTDSKRYWICLEGGCGVSVHTNLANEFLSIFGIHDHAVRPDELERKALKEKMKNRILAETTSITKIYIDVIIPLRRVLTARRRNTHRVVKQSILPTII